MKKLLAVSFSIAILSAALSIFAQMHLAKIADKKKADKMVKVAGTLKIINENGWFMLNDQKHTPINISKIEIDGAYIKIYYTFTASTIHSFIAAPDETLAAKGYFLGARVFRNYAFILVSRLNNGIVQIIDPSTIRSANGNIWVHGLFSVDEQIGEDS